MNDADTFADVRHCLKWLKQFLPERLTPDVKELLGICLIREAGDDMIHLVGQHMIETLETLDTTPQQFVDHPGAEENEPALAKFFDGEGK